MRACVLTPSQQGSLNFPEPLEVHVLFLVGFSSKFSQHRQPRWHREKKLHRSNALTTMII